jgi:hypothetical protein
MLLVGRAAMPFCQFFFREEAYVESVKVSSVSWMIIILM